MRSALEDLEGGGPEWGEVLGKLRAWRQVTATGKPGLKPLHARLGDDVRTWAQLWQVSLP